MKCRIVALLSVAVLGLTACPRGQIGGQPGFRAVESTVAAAPTRVPDLSGYIDFGVPGRSVQATMGEVGTGATVALIDINTGYTVTTALSTATGAFNLSFSNNWIPEPGKVFYLEAMKGLKAGTTMPNSVNADLARVRTLVRFYGGVWESVSAGGITLNPTSTALCILASLRSLTPLSANRHVDPTSLMGIMKAEPGTNTSPSPYAYSNTGLLPGELVRATYLQVLNALAQDRDPFTFIALDPADSLYNTLANVSSVQKVNALQPDSQFVGGTLTVVGLGFSENASENVVEFSDVSGGPVAATVEAVDAGGTRLTVKVPPGAVTGPVAVTIASRKMLGPTFFLSLKTGHEALDGAGILYVANEVFGTLASISPQGEVKTFATGLTSPRNLVVRAGKIYVTSAGAKKGVVAVDLSAPANPPTDFGVPGSIGDPRGVAFDDAGRCFVSDGAASKIWRIDSAGASPVALNLTGVSLSNPHALAFDLEGRLYVANKGSHSVLRVDVGTGVASTFLEGFSSPWGVAFDSIGNFYVSNNLGNSIYRWEAATSTLAPYADMPSPGGLVADRAGYLYAIDNTSNNVYRITPKGESSILASGISSPTGVVKVGTQIYVLSRENNALMRIDTGTSAISTLARGFNRPFGLTYDADRDLFYVSNPGNGTISSVERTTGKTVTKLVGTGTGYTGAWGIMYRGGRLYVRLGARVLGYDVTNFGSTPIEYQSVMQSNRGLSRDTRTSTGPFYLASSGNRVLKIVGDGTLHQSVNGDNKVVVFTDAAHDSEISSPRDVAVDGSGNVWVVNEGNGKVTTYKPDGTKLFASPITSGLGAPRGIHFDGSRIWVANNSARTITSYNPATAALDRTLSTGSENPLNLTFRGTTMYVVTNQGVGKFDNYTVGSPAYVSLYTGLTNYIDIEVDASGRIFVMNGASSAGGRRIDPDSETGQYASDVAWYSNYGAPAFLWRDAGGTLWLTDRKRFTHAGHGDWVYRLVGIDGDSSNGPFHAGIDSNGNIFLNSTGQCGYDAVGRLKIGEFQEEWTYHMPINKNCWIPATGGFANDEQGNFYLGQHFGARISVVDAAGNVRNIAQASNVFESFGIWAEPDGSRVLQTIESHHRIEQVTVSNGARQILPYGLSSAEM